MLQPQFSIVYDLIDHTDHRNGIQSTRRRSNSPTVQLADGPTRRRIKSSRDVGELVLNPIQLIRS